MTSAVVYTYLFIHLGIILVVTAYYAVGAMLAPGMTARARIRFARRPWLPVLVGLACSVPWVLAAILLLNAASAPLRFAGATIGCLWVLAGLLGFSAPVVLELELDRVDRVAHILQYRGGGGHHVAFIHRWVDACLHLARGDRGLRRTEIVRLG